MNVIKRYILLISFLPLCAWAQSNCAIDIGHPDPSISEITLGDLGSKIEANNRILKMKLTGAFDTIEWTWVSFKNGPAKITGIVAGKRGNGVLGEVIAVDGKGGDANWAIFKSHDPFVVPNSGRAYFMIDKSLSCVDTTLREWTVTAAKVFGDSFAEQTSVTGQEAGQAYKGLGLR